MLMICIAFRVSLLRYHMRGKALEQQSHKIWASCFKDLSCLCLSQALVGIGMMLQLVIRGGKEGGGGGLSVILQDLLAGQSLPLGLYGLTYQPHTSYKYIYSE